MTEVHVQMCVDGRWQDLPSLTKDTQPGTMTTENDELVMFGWMPDGAGPALWRMDGHHHLIDAGVNRVTNGTPVLLSHLEQPYEFASKLGVRVRIAAS